MEKESGEKAFSVVKVKRKIVPKQERVVTSKLDTQQYGWHKSPPRLPRTNIYEKKMEPRVLPPPLPPQLSKFSLKPKAKQGIVKPPPLPKIQRWKTALAAIKPTVKPPPLPTRNLEIAPFLSVK